MWMNELYSQWSKSLQLDYLFSNKMHPPIWSLFCIWGIHNISFSSSDKDCVHATDYPSERASMGSLFSWAAHFLEAHRNIIILWSSPFWPENQGYSKRHFPPLLGGQKPGDPGFSSVAKRTKVQRNHVPRALFSRPRWWCSASSGQLLLTSSFPALPLCVGDL